MKPSHNNGKDRNLYGERVKVIDGIVKTKIELKKQHDTLLEYKSNSLKQGKLVQELRRELDKFEDKLVVFYTDGGN